ncbi:hybrid sensor histidine kinase/response regulator [Halopseudomonas aestusnigri]|uniref:ATP-binding response regulator n=1 Tax=Halopseudomonas aestusnigri TaxID=857252 RepID=UPI0030C6C7C0
MSDGLAGQMLAPWRLPEARLFNEQAKLITQHLLGVGIVGASMLGLFCALTLYWLFDDRTGFFWLACSWLLNSTTYVLLRNVVHRTMTAPRRFWLLVGVFASTGIVWGVLPLLILDASSPIPLLLIMVVIITHGAGTFAINASSMPLYCAYIYPAVAPLMIVSLFSSDPLMLGLGGLCFIYLLCMTMFASGAQQAARHSLQLQFTNLELVEQLRAESEQRELARSEAVSANRAKSSFLAAASHDLRQPLHALGLFLEALGRSGINGRQQEMLDNAAAVSASARHMLNTLLDYSRLEAGVIEPARCGFRLQTLFSKLEREFGPQADAQGLVYRCRDTVLAVDTDPSLVELILRNLISNALRYTEQGGVLVACRRRGAMAHIEVWDTGIGIAEENHQAVFQEFFQLGNPERDRRKGLGLGLAIVQGLCNTLGVELELTSVSGKGSVFRLIVPVERGGVVSDTSAPVRKLANFDGVSVLVVDDDEAVRVAMSELLSSWGCRCLVADSAASALQGCSALPDLLIVDYRLRDGQTGADVMAALRERLGVLPPTFIITGDTAPDRLREAQSTGALLLHKPVDTTRLHDAISRVLGTHLAAK